MDYKFPGAVSDQEKYDKIFQSICSFKVTNPMRRLAIGKISISEVSKNFIILVGADPFACDLFLQGRRSYFLLKWLVF